MFKLNNVLWKMSHEYCASYPFRDVFHSPPVLSPGPFSGDNKMFHQTPCVCSKENDQSPAEIKAEKKKKNLFITLIGVDGKPSTSTLEAASKLSKRRDLKLIKVSDYDPRRQNPVYKLMSSSQILKDDIASKKLNKGKGSGFKSEKIISFSYKISDHDIESKVNQIIKWLQKKHEVRATISGVPDASMETVYEKIAAALNNNGRILQKRNSGHDIKFTVIPPKEVKLNKEKGEEPEPMDLSDDPEEYQTQKSEISSPARY